jgi:type II secretory pathway component PulJ
MIRKPQIRTGFTLLEVMLSSVITILLMAALYVALDVQLRQAQIGRDLVAQATLSRSIIQRLRIDLSPVLTPIPRGSTSSSSSSTGTE